MSPYVLGLAAVAGLAYLVLRGRTMGDGFSVQRYSVTSTGLPNRPPPGAVASLRRIHNKIVVPLERQIQAPVTITSGYRSYDVNKAVGGSRTSDHLNGRAVDMVVQGMDSRQLAREIIAARIPFDQMIWYAPSRGGHVHIGLRDPGRNRGQVLHASPAGGYTSEAP